MRQNYPETQHFSQEHKGRSGRPDITALCIPYRLYCSSRGNGSWTAVLFHGEGGK